MSKRKFQLLLKECTIEAGLMSVSSMKVLRFQLLLKECTIEAKDGRTFRADLEVSVVIERMYD